MNYRRSIIGGLLGIPALSWHGLGLTQVGLLGSNSSAIQVNRKLRFTIQMSNTKAFALERQILWMYLPAQLAVSHELLSVSVSSPYAIEQDRLGHAILRIQWSAVPAFAQRVISVTCELRLRAEANIQKPETLRNWLQHERYIEVNDSQIQALAKQLRSDSHLQTAQNIYEWVANNLTYAGYIADDLGAQYALAERRGDCTEYAYLTVALARASGIPARMIGGFVVERDGTPNADEYHNWAQLWIDDKWLVLDPQKMNWLDPKLQYISFRYFQNEAVHAIGLAHRYRVDGQLSVKI
jgi:hypothetical protein